MCALLKVLAKQFQYDRRDQLQIFCTFFLSIRETFALIARFKAVKDYAKIKYIL